MLMPLGIELAGGAMAQYPRHYRAPTVLEKEPDARCPTAWLALSWRRGHPVALGSSDYASCPGAWLTDFKIMNLYESDRPVVHWKTNQLESGDFVLPTSAFCSRYCGNHKHSSCVWEKKGRAKLGAKDTHTSSTHRSVYFEDGSDMHISEMEFQEAPSYFSQEDVSRILPGDAVLVTVAAKYVPACVFRIDLDEQSVEISLLQNPLQQADRVHRKGDWVPIIEQGRISYVRNQDKKRLREEPLEKLWIPLTSIHPAHLDNKLPQPTLLPALKRASYNRHTGGVSKAMLTQELLEYLAHWKTDFHDSLFETVQFLRKGDINGPISAKRLEKAWTMAQMEVEVSDCDAHCDTSSDAFKNSSWEPALLVGMDDAATLVVKFKSDGEMLSVHKKFVRFVDRHLLRTPRDMHSHVVTVAGLENSHSETPVLDCSFTLDGAPAGAKRRRHQHMTPSTTRNSVGSHTQQREDRVATHSHSPPADLIDGSSRTGGYDGMARRAVDSPSESLVWRTYEEKLVVLSEGGAVATMKGGLDAYALVTIGEEVVYGEHYWEVKLLSRIDVDCTIYVGISRPNLRGGGAYIDPDCTDGWFMCLDHGSLNGNGKCYDDVAGVHYAPTELDDGEFEQGDHVGVLLDLDDGSLRFFRNGIEQGSGYGTGSVAGPVVLAIQMSDGGDSVRLLGEGAHCQRRRSRSSYGDSVDSASDDDEEDCRSSTDTDGTSYYGDHDSCR
jgi:hypothetical protein